MKTDILGMFSILVGFEFSDEKSDNKISTPILNKEKNSRLVEIFKKNLFESEEFKQTRVEMRFSEKYITEIPEIIKRLADCTVYNLSDPQFMKGVLSLICAITG